MTMRKILILFVFRLSMHNVDAQGTWTWIHGDSVTSSQNFTAVRGTLGIPAASNKPPGYVSRGTKWVDNQGKIWVLSTVNYVSGDAKLEIWSYNKETNQWTWEADRDSIYIVGTLPSYFLGPFKNYPIVWYQGNSSWVDSSGNLWYFHKVNVLDSSCNFIVKFNIQTKKFEIINYRINYSNYGNKGLASASNWPSFFQGSSTWRIGEKVFLYGGFRDISNYSNELWEYNMKSGYWTWHGGEFPPSAAKYGTKGLPSINNWPTSIYNTISNWIKGDKLFFFGGLSSYGRSNELWEYDLTTKMWTWLNGEKTSAYPNHKGVYSSINCKDTIGLVPYSREGRSSLASNDCKNSFWYYGGWGDNNDGYYTGQFQDVFSDLWLYNSNNNRWMWVYGGLVDTNYHYGIKGVASIYNKPPARSDAMMWTDDQNRLYLFGGSVYSIRIASGHPDVYTDGNDLWRYDPDYSCINYSLSEKFIDRNIKYRLCIGDSSVVKIREGYDSIRVIPMTNVTIKGSSATGAEITLRPPVNRSYQIIAYGYRCESYLDSLTVPLQVFPTRASTEAKTICYGQSYMGKFTTGTYVFTYRDPLSCDSTHTLSLTVRPQIVTTLDTTICEGQVVRGRTTTGSYADTLTAASGCDSIVRLHLTVIPKFLTIDTSICRGKSLYGYTTAGTYYDTLTSSQGCITYRTLRLSIREPSSSTHTQTICEGQSYWGHSTTGTHTDILIAANGCDSTRTLNLTVNKKSYFTLTKEICRGESYEGRSQAGTYLDTFRNAKGCDSIRTLVLTLRNPQVIKKLKDTAICRGSEAILNAGLGHRDYLWSTGEVSPSILVKNEGEYKLSYTDTANCKGRDSAKLIYHNDTEIILQDEISNYKGELLFLNPQIKPSDMGGKYRWTPSYMFQCDSCRTVRFRLDSSAVVRLEFTDAQGCRAYKDVQVNIYDSWAVGFPTAFSPNGDGTNDEYFPNVENILSYNIAIYNRWGEKVYASDNLTQKWDGRYKGEPVPLGSYSYFAEVILLNQARKTYTGTFHLVR